MDLQLYKVDSQNYLVDFRNVGYYRTPADQPGFSHLPNPIDIVSSPVQQQPSEEDGHLHPHYQPSTSPTYSPPLKSTHPPSSRTSMDHTMLGGSDEALAASSARRAKAQGSSGERRQDGIQEVTSPFLFLDCACRLIVELAGG